MIAKSILVTGGSGSFGTAFVRRLLRDSLSERIIVYSRGEHRQEDMARDFAPLDPDKRLRFRIGCVRDRDRLELAVRGCDVVVHAAALKVVPICEADPAEAIKTNILGALNVVEAALRTGVKKVMALSTDKAASASTLYGATKFAAERLFIASNVYTGVGMPTRFSCVRYGNCIGSNGAVVPLFRKLVAGGATALPITDVRMTRFFWEVEDAVEFTLSSIGMMAGGEVFVPKIRARRIVDVASEIAPHLPQLVVGVRGNEKLHETLISEDEARMTLDVGDRYVIKPSSQDWDSSHLSGAIPVADGFKFSSASANVPSMGWTIAAE